MNTRMVGGGRPGREAGSASVRVLCHATDSHQQGGGETALGIPPLTPSHEVQRLRIDKVGLMYPVGGMMRLIICLVSVKVTI